MITSNSNQYLPPDYFSLPANLDSKKSPLALLAQTCSQIGADNSYLSNKSVQDKSVRKKSPEATSPTSSTCSSRCSPVTSAKSNYIYKSCESTSVKEPINRKISTKPISNVVKESTVISSPSSSPDGVIRSISSSTSSSSNNSKRIRKTSSALQSPQLYPQDIARSRAGSVNSTSSSPLIDKIAAESISSSKPYVVTSTQSTTSVITSTTSTGGISPITGYSDSLYYPLKTGLLYPYYLGPTALSSSYYDGRMKNNSDLSSTACRDPFCVGCQLNAAHLLTVQNASKTVPCSVPGCNQCAEVKSNFSTSGGGSFLCRPHLLAATYAQAQLTALAAASQMPYVCSWVAADTTAYCGKRFFTSEELMQHLRTHTTDTGATTNFVNSFFNRAPTSGNYPSSSPFASNAFLAASRYHPYSKSPFLQHLHGNYSSLASNNASYPAYFSTYAPK